MKELEVICPVCLSDIGVGCWEDGKYVDDVHMGRVVRYARIRSGQSRLYEGSSRSGD